ncbi:hypothetical protein Tco_1169818, partial [Tanacetum coccineum]
METNLGRDGQPMKPLRQFQFGVQASKVAVETGIDGARLDYDQSSQSTDGWDDQGINAMKNTDVNANNLGNSQPKTFATVLNDVSKTTKVNFRTLFNKEHVVDTDFVLPLENVDRAYSKFENSLVGFFVGKKVAFPLVRNYVTNTWSKFRFQKAMSDDDGLFYFKFASMTCIEQVLEKGSWMIRNQPIILTKWAPNLELSKGKVTKVPTWVKIHKVPVVAYSADAVEELKREVTMVVPVLHGKGYTKETMKVEYEWQPPRCDDCLVFGHDSNGCPKQVTEPANEKNEVHNNGFTTVRNRKNKGKRGDTVQARSFEGIKLSKPKPNFVWSVKSNQASTSSEKATTDGEKLDTTNKKATDVVLNNSFDMLAEDDRVDWNDELTWQNAKRAANIINESDSEDIDQEIVLETHPGQYAKGASTPSKSHVTSSRLEFLCSHVFRQWSWTSNGSWCSK